MKSYYSALGLLSLSASVSFGAAQPLDYYLPVNSALVVSVANYTELNKQCTDGPLNALVNDPKINDAVKPIKDYLEKLLNEDSETPFISWEEIKEHLDGQIVAGVDISPWIEAAKTGDEDESIPTVVFLAECKDAEGLIDLICTRVKDEEKSADPIGSIVDKEEFQGVTIHHFVPSEEKLDSVGSEENTDDSDGEFVGIKNSDDEAPADSTDSENNIYFGNIKDVIFATLDAESAHAIIEAIKGKEDGTLAVNQQFAKFRPQAENLDAFMYLTAKPIADGLEAFIRNKTKSTDGEEVNPMAPSADGIINALGMNSIKYISFGFDIEYDNVHIVGGLNADSTYGIGRLLRAYGDNYPTPDFVPESVFTLNASGFNLGTFILETRQIIFTAFPAASIIYQSQIAPMQEQAGINIDADFINNFDDGLLSFALPPTTSAETGAPDINSVDTLFALKIKNPDSFKRALDAILMITPVGPSIERRDFNGNQIIIIPNISGGEPLFAIAIKDGWVMMGKSPATLQNALSVNKDVKTFWQTTTYNNLGEGKLASGGIAMSYVNVDTFAQLFLTGLAQVFNESDDVKNGKVQPIDISLVNAIKDLPFYICGKGYRTNDGISSDSYLIKKD